MKALGAFLLLGVIAVSRAQFSLDVMKPPEEELSTVEPPTNNLTYWVTYNNKIRPGQDMVFNTMILKGSTPVTVTVTLLNQTYEKVLLQSVPTVCHPGVMKAIRLKVPYDLERPSEIYKYSLIYGVNVIGVGSGKIGNFKKQGVATLQEKSFSIYVQTDKAMYKPRQEVKFRVVAVTPGMKVMKDVLHDIVVKDANENRILHYRALDASETMGVVQKSFQLADNIPLGDWTIEANVMGRQEIKTFTVAEYVLPKFEVEIDAPTFGVRKDSHLNFTVKAKYTFGKPVTGSVVEVEIKKMGNYVYWGSDVLERGPQMQVKTINRKAMLDRDGKFDFHISRSDLLDLTSTTYLDSSTFIINATVIEERTQKRQSAAHNIQYHKTPIKMEFLPISPKSLKSGMDSFAYLEVRKRDDSLLSPEESRQITIKFSGTYEYRVEKPTTTTTTTTTTTAAPTTSTMITTDGITEAPFPDPPFNGEHFGRPGGPFIPDKWVSEKLILPTESMNQVLPDSGWVVLRYNTPEKFEGINIQASLEWSNKSIRQYAYFDGDAAHSPSKSFVQLNVTQHKPKVGDVVTVNATASELMKNLYYQISAKGDILHSERMDSVSPKQSIAFEFEVTSAMSPNINLLAYYIRDDGEFVVDALSLSVEGLFANSVDIKFSKEKVKPGESVDVIVKAEQDSMVFTLAVDKSVKLLKSGNDITQELVREELLQYEGGSNYGPWRYMFFCGWPSYNSGSDAGSVLRSAGVTVLTDGNIYHHQQDFGGGIRFPDGLPTLELGGPVSNGKLPQDRAPPQSNQLEKTKTRRIFPENWLWSMVYIPGESTGEVRFNLTAPDTITSWVASAFSLHPTSGLSVVAEPAEVITFRDMFVSLDLPAFIVRNEDFCFTVSVFSYYNGTIPVRVKLEKSDDFSSIYTRKNGERIDTQKNKVHFSIILGMMSAGDIESTMFCFTPEVLGDIPIRVSALTNVPGLSDAVERKIRVKAEGVPRTMSKPFLVGLTNGKWNETVAINFPVKTVKGSEKITINVAGNLLGSIFENLDNLVKQPYGCGEQNMINFSPLMSVLNFLLITGTDTPEMRMKIKDFMLQGYQKELMYEHQKTGGFSAFGDKGSRKVEPSTWLTAFVLKSFSAAKNLDNKYSDVLEVDSDVIARTVAFLISKQSKDGSFYETGKVFNKRLQGGSGEGEGLTAYTMIALLNAHLIVNSSSRLYIQIETSLQAGQLYLESRIAAMMNDPYDLCIANFILAMRASRLRTLAFNNMENLAITGPGIKYWERQEEVQVQPRYHWTKDTTALSVEMTSYALLTYNQMSISQTDGLNILGWLGKQKNPNGGFISTQDTVIAIEALTEVAAILYTAEYTPMTVTMSAGGTVTSSVNMVKENEMILHRIPIPYQAVQGDIISLQASANSPVDGITTVLVEVVMDYNVEDKSTSTSYTLDHSIQTGLNVQQDVLLAISIASTTGEPASMTVLEVEIPAGYSVDVKETQSSHPDISKAELKNDLIVLYFDTDVIDTAGTDLEITMERTGGGLTKSKPRSMKVYSYYEPEFDLTVMYTLAENEFCNVVPGVGLCPYQ